MSLASGGRLAVPHLWSRSVQPLMHGRNLWVACATSTPPGPPAPHIDAQRWQQCVTQRRAPVTKSFQIVQPHPSRSRASGKVVLRVFT